MMDRRAASSSALVSCSHASLLSPLPPPVLHRSWRANSSVVRHHMLPGVMSSCVSPASASSARSQLTGGGPMASTEHDPAPPSRVLARQGLASHSTMWRRQPGVLSCPPQASYGSAGSTSSGNNSNSSSGGGSKAQDSAGSAGGGGLSSLHRSIPLDIPKFQSMGFIAADPASRDASKRQIYPPPISVAYSAIVPLSTRLLQPAVDGASRPSSSFRVLSTGGGGTETGLLGGGTDNATDVLDVINPMDASGVIQIPLSHQPGSGRDGAAGGTSTSSRHSGNGHSHASSQTRSAGGTTPWGQQQPFPARGGGVVVEDDVLSRQRAEVALSKADSSLDNIEKLQNSSAEGENDAAPGPQGSGGLLGGGGAAGRYSLPPILRAVREVVIVGALSFALLVSHAFGIWFQMMAAVVVAGAIAGWGLKRGALSRSGALAAAVVGVATLSCSLRMGATLVAFFFTSSKLTQYKEALKAGLDDSSKAGGQRDWVQVACNGAVPAALAVAYGVLAGCVDVPLGVLPALEPWRAQCLTGLMGAFLGYYACCCGDTWASELGPLSREMPRLITTGRQVPKGTNGGVTILGLSASILGGMLIGLVFYLSGLLSPTLWVFKQQQTMAVGQWRLIPLGLMAGLLGSVLDSLFGATLQYSGRSVVTGKITSRAGPDVEYISGQPLLSNSLVNLLSASMTAALTASIAMHMFGV